MLSCSLIRTMPKKKKKGENVFFFFFFNNIILEDLSLYSYLHLSSGWWHLRSIQFKYHPKTHNAVFVGERLPSIWRRTYLENKATLVAFWFWKFHVHRVKLFDMYGSWPARNDHGGSRDALPCGAAHWPRDICCQCVHPAQAVTCLV